MYLLVIFLPFIGCLGVGLFGRYFGSKGSILITVTCLFFSFFFSLFLFYEVGLCGCPCYIKLSPWIESGLFSCWWGFQFDSITVCMLLVVTIISFFVHGYSSSYMSEDLHLSRFMSYLSFFTFFMLALVTADNFLQLFFGWEGVGLCSYLLINFWFTRVQANKSAIKAMLLNRVGDLGLSVGITIIFFTTKTLTFSSIFSLSYLCRQEEVFFLFNNLHELSLACLFLFIGTIGKSAQLGLHTWLPDAMEGPTPVSALIHAATMVTAGVFLVVRCSYLFEFAPTILAFMALIGGTTAFFGSTIGLTQNDLKKIVAYSTCSQLGYMVFICGLSGYTVGFFHLVNHAFFKALLFLSAGAVIHSMSDEQDLRRMGGLVSVLPFSYSMFLVGSLALMGTPFLTGFYSKDIILELAYSHYSISGLFSYWLGSSAAFFTAFYSWRLLYLTFLGRVNGLRFNYKIILESSFPIFSVLFILGWCSIFIGFLLKDCFIGLGTCFWGSSIFVLFDHVFTLESEFLPNLIKLCPVFISFFGSFLSLVCYSEGRIFLFKIFSEDYLLLTFSGLNWFSVRRFYIFLSQKWFFDRVYNENIAEILLNFGYTISWKTVDKGFLEILGPEGVSLSFLKGSFQVSSFQTGYIAHYLFLFFLGFVLFTLFLFFSSGFQNFFYNIDDRIWFIINVLLCFLFKQLKKKQFTIPMYLF
jgi:proton-translocating NADH-quinone oxidoreductase chain L